MYPFKVLSHGKLRIPKFRNAWNADGLRERTAKATCMKYIIMNVD